MLSSHITIPPYAPVAHSLGAFRVHGIQSPSVDQEKLARRAEEHNAIIENVVRRVYEFARTSARHLSDVCGQEEDYYLRLIFHHGAALHPMLEQDAFSSYQFTSCE